MVIDFVYGWTAMFTTLALLELAATACPRRVEGTFFALLMSVYTFGKQGSQITGGSLYDWFGYAPLVLVATGTTTCAWLLVPLVGIDRIEARARAAAVDAVAPAP